MKRKIYNKRNKASGHSIAVHSLFSGSAGLRYLTMILPILLGVMMFTSCSMTKRLAEGETLYRGVKKFEIIPPEGEKLPEEMVSDMKAAIDVAPNGPMPFMSPYMTQPFPVGLWIYNAM
ncbi:MAG: hypothetical protein K2J15_07645, partial [Muribaculaceae bacterium]|nr:hypothetical protein [Muribaculaceae bacterium]